MLHKNKLTTTIDTVFLVNKSIIQILSLPTIELSQKKKKKYMHTTVDKRQIQSNYIFVANTKLFDDQIN